MLLSYIVGQRSSV